MFIVRQDSYSYCQQKNDVIQGAGKLGKNVFT